MNTITITQPINPNLLNDQLFTAFPEWRYQTARGATTDVILEQRDNAYVLHFPDATDPAKVQALINAHDPAGKSVNDLEQDATDAARAELGNRPAWLTDLSYTELENYITAQSVGSVTETQALAAVDAIANLDDVKAILRNVIKAVYALVRVQTKIARIVLVAVHEVAKRL